MDRHIITLRRGELEREREGLKQRLEAISVEFSELDIAERVFDRLSSLQWNQKELIDEAEMPVLAKVAASENLTVREMIKAALMDARQRNLVGLTPKQIRSYMHSVYGRDAGQQVNTNLHRMLTELNEVLKDEETGLYSLPHKEKPSDDKTLAGTSEGFEFNPDAKGREAGPGGGT